MTDIIMNKDMKDFDEKRNPNASYLVFRVNPNGEGTDFVAQIIHPQKEGYPASTHIFLSHKTLDAYIYALQDMKQTLELQRIRNGKA